VVVAAWTLVSRITGLLRVVVIGAVLGPTFLANTFLATNTVPSLTYSVVAGPVLGLVVVPAVVGSLVDRGLAESSMLLRRLSTLLVVASTGLALLLVLVAPLLAWSLTLGVPAGPGHDRARRLTEMMLMFVAPQVVLYTVAALGAAAQQARGRFALAAAAPALENVGLMLTMAVVAARFGPGLDVGEAPVGLVVLLGTGATLSVAAHAAVQVAGAARVGLSLRPVRGWRTDPAARQAASRLRGSVAVAALPAASFYALLALSATVRGGVLVIQMAYAVYSVPAALGARAVTTVALPGLSGAARSRDLPGYAAAWRQALSYALMVGVPALCLLVGFASPIAETLANGELRTPQLVPALAACIGVLGIAQLAAGVHEIGRQALFARLDVTGPRRAGALAFTATLLLGAACLAVPVGTPRLVALCGVVLLADVAAAVTVTVFVRRAIRPADLLDLRGAAATGAGAVTMLPVISAAVVLTDITGGGRLHDLAVVVPLTLLAATLFVLTSAAVRGRLADPS
jgi:putative peptidoglycan lipid II flippase